MSEKQTTQEQMKAQVEKAKDALERLKKGTETEVQYFKSDIEDLKGYVAQAQKKLQQFEQSAANEFKEFKADSQELWANMKSSTDKLLAKFKK